MKSKSSNLKSQPSLLRRLWLKSQTKFIAWSQGTGALFLGAVSNTNSYVNDPHFKDYLSNFTVPKYVYIGLATLALLTWLGHGRDQDA